MSDRGFQPGRVRLARELNGWSQAELARQIRLTPAALSQFESGATQPSAATRGRLAKLLSVPAGFFELPLVDTHEGFFRSLRRTSLADRRRARAIAHIAHDLATCGGASALLADPAIPNIPVTLLSDDLDEVERIAADVRGAWGIPRGPAPNLIELLESHGIVAMRLPLASADVDAFSLPFSDRPVVVLGAEKNDRARSRFDAAHELGHLVMHGDQLWGLPEVEHQANRFAAAFLMPREDIEQQLPERADWPRLFYLKRHWEVSLAALLMRARIVGRMSDADYLSAVKTISARGWRRVEPVPLGRPEKPQLLKRLLDSPTGDRCRSVLPQEFVEALATALAA